MVIDEVHEYNSDGSYERWLSLSAKPTIQVLIDRLNEIGMPRPTSREELKDAMDYYSCICGITDFTKLNGGD